MPKNLRQQKRERREARRKAKRKEIRASQASLGGLTSQLHRAAEWPVMECWVNATWENPEDLSQVVVARRNPATGEGWAALCLVDRACLGGKNANAMPFASSAEFRAQILNSVKKTQDMVQVDFNLAAAIVQAGLDYAASLGFKPHRDYKYAQILLKGADVSAVKEEIAVGGKDGKPFFIAGPYDNVDKILRHLTERLGPDGFIYLIPIPGPDGFGDSEEVEDFEVLD